MSTLLSQLHVATAQFQRRVAKLAEDGVWRTIHGRPVFIHKGELAKDAFKRALERGGYKKETVRVRSSSPTHSVDGLVEFGRQQTFGALTIGGKDTEAKAAIKQMKKEQSKEWFMRTVGKSGTDRIAGLLTATDTIKATSVERRQYEISRLRARRHVEKVFNTVPATTTDIMLHRGAPIGFEVASDLAAHLDSGKGVVFNFNSYASTSSDKSPAEKFSASWRDEKTGLRGQGATLSFLVPKGSKVVSVSSLAGKTATGRVESEFFVPKGSRVRIIGYTQEKLTVGAHTSFYGVLEKQPKTFSVGVGVITGTNSPAPILRYPEWVRFVLYVSWEMER